MITGVAVKYGRVIIDLPRPNRHGDVLNLVHREFNYVGQGECGFVTENGDFLDRIQAVPHALKYGQLQDKWDGKLTGPKWVHGYVPERLYSEDLW